MFFIHPWTAELILYLWHMRLCTIERQASALVGATEDIFVFWF